MKSQGKRPVSRLRVPRGLGGALFLTTVVVLNLYSENITLTTSYPSPAGIYQRLTTTGATTLARDGGRVGIALGTAAPKATLDVGGS